MIGTQWEREREAETQAEGEAGSTHREPDMGFDPGSPGSRPGPKTGAKPLRHPGIPRAQFSTQIVRGVLWNFVYTKGEPSPSLNSASNELWDLGKSLGFSEA